MVMVFSGVFLRCRFKSRNALDGDTGVGVPTLRILGHKARPALKSSDLGALADSSSWERGRSLQWISKDAL
jgi:hypothetical protein